MRATLGLAVLFGFTLLTTSPGFAKSPGTSNDNETKSDSATAVAPDSDSSTANSGDPSSSAAAPAPAQMPATGTAPAVVPIAATTGTLGLFSLETGETLPRHGWSFSAYGNKFTRMPGSVSVLQLGMNFSYGVNTWLNLYVNWDPEQHTHIGFPGSAATGFELSLDTPTTGPPNCYPLYGSTVYRSLHAFTTCANGQTLARPGYVADFPFAANNGGGTGPLTVGLKFGLISEARGAPVSLSLRNDFIIPTVRSLANLVTNGTQTGQFDDQISLALSKNLRHVVVLSANLGYEMTRDPRQGSVSLLTQPDQARIGVGFILFPNSRIQFMNEYTGLAFVGAATPNSTFGAADPVDGVWGVRLYPLTAVGIDLGYRYMLNLPSAVDRNGFVIKVGVTHLPPRPPPPNHPPVVSCSLDKPSVFAGTDDSINITATASDPDGDTLNYSWTATGGRVDGTGPQVRWLPMNVAPGSYTVTATVDDGRGGTASCSVNPMVAQRPNRPPTVSLSSDRPSVLVGERVHFTATGSDPDGDPLSYTWRTNGGQISPATTTTPASTSPVTTTADLDTTGVAPGTYTVTVRADDGRGGAADASANIQVNAPPPPPQASKINGCDFKALNSARVDNVCKRVLDDVALRLQNAPRATIVIIGYADPRERRAANLASSRGDNAAKYLTDKGVDHSRINTRPGTGQAGAGQANRRIDIIWVPEGATY